MLPEIHLLGLCQPPSAGSETPAEMSMPKIGNVTNWSSLYEHVVLPAGISRPELLACVAARNADPR